MSALESYFHLLMRLERIHGAKPQSVWFVDRDCILDQFGREEASPRCLPKTARTIQSVWGIPVYTWSTLHSTSRHPDLYKVPGIWFIWHDGHMEHVDGLPATGVTERLVSPGQVPSFLEDAC